MAITCCNMYQANGMHTKINCHTSPAAVKCAGAIFGVTERRDVMARYVAAKFETHLAGAKNLS